MGSEDAAAAFPSSTASSPRFCNPIIISSSRRIFSDVAEDVTVSVDGQSFLLHKFPLVSRCGRLRKLLAGSGDPDQVPRLELANVPGGAPAFELAAKFCYGSNLEVTAGNAAALRCVAEFLEMTEEYRPGNLLARAETYLTDVALKSLDGSLRVLRGCDGLGPAAEEVGLVGRCVDAVALHACKEQLVSGLAQLELDECDPPPPPPAGSSSSGRRRRTTTTTPRARRCRDWWVEDLSALRIDHYRRVVAAMRRSGVSPESIGASIMHYAQASLKGGGGGGGGSVIIGRRHGWDSSGPLAGGGGGGGGDDDDELRVRVRVVVETLIDLLATEDITAVTLSFLFGMLRMAVEVDAGLAYRIEVEKRIGPQLEMASLDDLLIPSARTTSESMFDVDAVHRILVNFLQRIVDQQDDGSGDELSSPPPCGYDSDGLKSPSHGSVLKVGRLMDGYLAEIAPDPYLKLQKFMAIIELLPDYARIVDDGLYRAIDIYLKAHPSLTDSECKKLCKLMDCQKLSQDACSHAAQNERLPVQTAVRVLYLEQLRLKSSFFSGGGDGPFSQRVACSGVPSSCVSPRDNYASLRRENRELKLEVSRMRVRLTELEREQGLMKRHGRAGDHGRAFLASLSRGIGRIATFRPERRRKESSRWQCSEGEGRRRQKAASFAYD